MKNGSQMFLNEPIWIAVTAIVAILALVLSFVNFFEPRRKRRRRLVHAIYHHANKATDAIREAQEYNESVRNAIRLQKSYLPYIPRSNADDLAYDQIIEVMELLNQTEGDAILEYFHAEMKLHAIAASFDSEVIGPWRPERKLCAWKRYEESQAVTHDLAQKTKEILAKHR